MPGRNLNVRGVVDGIRDGLHIGERNPAPVVLGLLAVWLAFQGLDDEFLSPRNLSNLSIDIVGTGLVALAIVFVLTIGEIDLSVGSVSALAGAVFAVLSVNLGMPEWLAIIVSVGSGTAVGAVQGIFVAALGVPAFFVTLGGLVAWNGLTLLLLGAAGNINIDDQGLVAALTSYYFTGIGAAYGLAALVTTVYFLTSYRHRRRRKAAGPSYRPLREVWVRTSILALIAFTAAFVLNQSQGLPVALLIFLVVLTGSDYVLRRTRYGRTIFAVGGSAEAARRAGIEVVWVRISVFMVSGALAAIGGLFVASVLTSAIPTTARAAGSGLLVVNAIAAAVIGGTSLLGGRGSAWSALLGVLVIQSITSGMRLLGVQDAVQLLVTGGVLVAAVTIGTLSRRFQEVRGRT